MRYSSSCYLLQDVVERSRQKSEMLQGFGDMVLRVETLEKELTKARKHSAMLQSKFDAPSPSTIVKCKICRRRAMNLSGRTSRSAIRTKVCR
jgi:hypothetical protein